MNPGCDLFAFRTAILLLILLTLPGDCNEGSIAGRCLCNRRFSNSPKREELNRFRRLLHTYNDCSPYIRFNIAYGSQFRHVCGARNDPWVLDLMSCYEKRECGYTHSHSQSVAHQQHLPPGRNQVPESTPLSTSTLAQTSLPPSLQSAQQPTLPAATPFLNKNSTYTNETTTFIAGQSLGTALKIREKYKENERSAATKSAVVPVSCLLGIVFVLIIILLYTWCKRQQPQQNSPDLNLHYTRLAAVSTATTNESL